MLFVFFCYAKRCFISQTITESRQIFKRENIVLKTNYHNPLREDLSRDFLSDLVVPS